MKKFLAAAAAVVVMGWAGTASADLIITPAGPGLIGTSTDTANAGTWAEVCAAFTPAPAGCLALGLTELYKQNVGGGESGSAAAWYSTTFQNTPSDPEDATITWGGPGWISCPSCYLVVKDGNATPAQYLFSLGSWNGQETIRIEDFWAGTGQAGRGAISHVSIFGGPTAICQPGDTRPECNETVPEPAGMLLLGAGLVGLASQLRRRR